MSIVINGQDIDVIHLRHDGRSHDFSSSQFQSDITTQAELFREVENSLDLNSGALSGYDIDIVSTTKTLVIHPQAKFGT